MVLGRHCLTVGSLSLALSLSLSLLPLNCLILTLCAISAIFLQHLHPVTFKYALRTSHGGIPSDY